MRFIKDKVLKITEIADIRVFAPKNPQDFDRQKRYRVKWRGNGEPDVYYEAQILYLGSKYFLKTVYSILNFYIIDL